MWCNLTELLRTSHEGPKWGKGQRTGSLMMGLAYDLVESINPI